MWSALSPIDHEKPAPSARSKHSATVIGEYVYLLGGRNGNVPMKDFWKYNLVSGKWQQLKPTGDKLPCLQEHSAISYKDSIYVFGGEVGFSAGTETPLWNYDIKNNSWIKIKSKKGVATPKGRRGHTALVHKGYMLIYGGYQDLQGSSSELWAFHFETESWHLLSKTLSKNNDNFPLARHKHSAIMHDDSMWIYGGMTDLQERSDFWRFDTFSKNWHCIKTKINPGPLHSHAVCRLPSAMLLFGGERNGHPTNELWKFNFGLETWERILISGDIPKPRSETVAFVVTDLLLKGQTGVEARCVRIRPRTCISADRGSRHSSYLPNNKIVPCEQTFVFQPNQNNYTDGSNDLAQQYSENNKSSRNFLQEITKLSHISRLNNKCNYTVLTGCKNSDSTENLLKQHSNPPSGEDFNVDNEISTPSRGSMVKSKSAFVLKKKYNSDSSPEETKENNKKKVEFNNNIKCLTREPISVPNFATLTLPTPTLTPVEATKLVYLTDDEDNEPTSKDIEIKPSSEIFKVKRGESYSSHLGYADNPLYQHMINSSSLVPEEENVSSTSDYASIETMNRLSSASNYSFKTHDENLKNREKDKNGPFGFCNPNYMGPDIKVLLNGDDEKKNLKEKQPTQQQSQQSQQLQQSQQSQQPQQQQNKNQHQQHHHHYHHHHHHHQHNHSHNHSHNHNNHNNEQKQQEQNEEQLELQTYSKVYYRNSRPPRFLSLDNNNQKDMNKNRALSASRVERKIEKTFDNSLGNKLDSVSLYVYILGGKEQGQITVFQRPISIWRLKLF